MTKLVTIQVPEPLQRRLLSLIQQRRAFLPEDLLPRERGELVELEHCVQVAVEDLNTDFVQFARLDDIEQELVIAALRRDRLRLHLERLEMEDALEAAAGESDWQNSPELNATKEWLERITDLLTRLSEQFNIAVRKVRPLDVT